MASNDTVEKIYRIFMYSLVNIIEADNGTFSSNACTKSGLFTASFIVTGSPMKVKRIGDI